MNDRVRKLEASSAFAEEMLVAQIQSNLEELLEKTGCSKSDLAKRMGVTKARVSQIFSDDQNFTVRLVARAFHALGHKINVGAASTTKVETKSDEYSISNARQHNNYIVHFNETSRDHSVIKEWFQRTLADPSVATGLLDGAHLANFVVAQMPEPRRRQSGQTKSDLSRSSIDAWTSDTSNVVPIRKVHACA